MRRLAANTRPVTQRAISRSRHRGAIQLFAILLLAVSLLLPRGYMPVRTADGLLRITLCTGYGPAETVIAIPMDDSGDDDQTDDRQGQSCAFAGNSAPFNMADESHAASPMVWTTDRPDGPKIVGSTPGRGMAAPPPPSQAPPLALS